MREKNSTGFPAKHQSGSQPDPAIEKQIRDRCPNGELPCAVAFEIAKKIDVTAAVQL